MLHENLGLFVCLKCDVGSRDMPYRGEQGAGLWLCAGTTRCSSAFATAIIAVVSGLHLSVIIRLSKYTSDSAVQFLVNRDGKGRHGTIAVLIPFVMQLREARRS